MSELCIGPADKIWQWSMVVPYNHKYNPDLQHDKLSTERSYSVIQECVTWGSMQMTVLQHTRTHIFRDE